MRRKFKLKIFFAVFALLLSAAALTAFALEESDIDAEAFASGQAMLSYVCTPSVGSASNPKKLSYLFFNASDTTSLLTGTYKTVDTALYVPINSVGTGAYVYALTWVETVRQVDESVYSNLVYKIEAYNSSGNLLGSAASFVDQGNNKVASLSDLSLSAMYTQSLVHVGNTQESDFVQHTITISFDDASLLDYVKIFFHSRTDFTVQPDKVLTFPVTTVKLGAKTTEDIVAALEKIRLDNIYNTAGLVNALTRVNDSVESFQTASKEFQQNLQKQLEDFFNDGFDAAVESGLDKFKQKMEQEANDKLSSALDKIKKAMPVDIDGLQSSFDQLLQSVSTHDSSASLVFPGASVTLLGYDMQFWDDQPIDFDEFFNLPGMQLLLLPLRFLFVFGMAKYLIYYFSKLEKLITLHID